MELIVDVVEIKLYKLDTQGQRRKSSTADVDYGLRTAARWQARRAGQARQAVGQLGLVVVAPIGRLLDALQVTRSTISASLLSPRDITFPSTCTTLCQNDAATVNLPRLLSSPEV